MGLFGGNYNKPGPGVPKDAPKKKGLRLFWDIYVRVFWELIKLNLLFVLCCIPIVTIGPAFAGLTRVMMLMVRERPFFVVADYWEAFKANWKQGFLAWLFSTLGAAALVVAVVFYGSAAQQQPLMYAALLTAGVMLLVLGLASVFLYPLIVMFDFPFRVVVKNAFLLGLVCLKHSLPALLLVVVGGLLIALYFPFSTPFLMFFYFSHTAFLFSFAAWPGLEKYVVGGTRAEHQAE